MSKVNPRVSSPVQFLIENKDTAKSWLDWIRDNWETMTIDDARQSINRLQQLVRQLILIVLSRRMGRVLLYFQATETINGTEFHRIKYAISEANWMDFKHTTNVPLSLYVIDNDDGEQLTDPANQQAANNRTLFADIQNNLNKSDADGMPKYYIDMDGELAVVDGWEQASPQL